MSAIGDACTETTNGIDGSHITDDTEEGQEEWLSEEFLSDNEDIATENAEDSVNMSSQNLESNFDETMNSNAVDYTAGEINISILSQSSQDMTGLSTGSCINIEEALNSLDGTTTNAEPTLPSELNEFLVIRSNQPNRNTDGDDEIKEVEGPKVNDKDSDANSTEDLLRLLGEDLDRTDNKKNGEEAISEDDSDDDEDQEFLLFQNVNGQIIGNRKESVATLAEPEDTSDTEANIKSLNPESAVRIVNVAKRAEPEDMSDEENEHAEYSSSAGNIGRVAKVSKHAESNGISDEREAISATYRYEVCPGDVRDSSTPEEEEPIVLSDDENLNEDAATMMRMFSPTKSRASGVSEETHAEPTPTATTHGGSGAEQRKAPPTTTHSAKTESKSHSTPLKFTGSLKPKFYQASSVKSTVDAPNSRTKNVDTKPKLVPKVELQQSGVSTRSGRASRTNKSKSTDENPTVDELFDSLLSNSPDNTPSGQLRMMKPEEMDEDMPMDEESDIEDEFSDYDEIPSSCSEIEDEDDWFQLNITEERAGEYLPYLGLKAKQVLNEEKRRVETRIATLKESLTSLSDVAKQQNENIRKALKMITELDAKMAAT